MAFGDPTDTETPRDRINYALGILVERRGLSVTEAFRLMTSWSSDNGLSVVDVADLVVAESRAQDSAPGR